MTLSVRDTKIVNRHVKEANGRMVVIEKKEFHSATPKAIAHHCFCAGLLFHWSNNNYYIQEVKNAG